MKNAIFEMWYGDHECHAHAAIFAFECSVQITADVIRCHFFCRDRIVLGNNTSKKDSCVRKAEHAFQNCKKGETDFQPEMPHHKSDVLQLKVPVLLAASVFA